MCITPPPPPGNQGLDVFKWANQTQSLNRAFGGQMGTVWENALIRHALAPMM